MSDFDDVFVGLVGRENITIKALECWYMKDFAKYGMIVLAHAHGKRLKVLQYLTSLGSLVVKLRQKTENVIDPDRKQDLLIMLNRSQSLLTIALSQFNINLEEIKHIANQYGDEVLEVLENVVGQGQFAY